MSPRSFVAIAVAIVLAACGRGGAQNGDVPDLPPDEAQVAEAQAQPILFDPALTRPRCPARVDLTQYPGPELAGLKLGMTRADALAAAYCERQQFHVETTASYFELNTRGEQLAPQTILFRDGQRYRCGDQEAFEEGPVVMRDCPLGEYRVRNTTESIFVATPGLPGSERVLGIWRGQTFGANPPTVEATIATLVQRFGEPTERKNNHIADYRQGVRLSWLRDANGAALTSGSTSAGRCDHNLNPGYQDGQTWANECGVTITAIVWPSTTNRDVAESYQVVLADQHALWQTGVSMQQHYADAEAATRAQETERARNAQAPDL